MYLVSPAQHAPAVRGPDRVYRDSPSEACVPMGGGKRSCRFPISRRNRLVSPIQTQAYKSFCLPCLGLVVYGSSKGCVCATLFESYPEAYMISRGQH